MAVAAIATDTSGHYEHANEVLPEIGSDHVESQDGEMTLVQTKAKAKADKVDVIIAVSGGDSGSSPCASVCPAGVCKGPQDRSKPECAECAKCFERIEEKAIKVKKEINQKEESRTKEVKKKAAEGAVKQKLLRVKKQADEAEAKMEFNEQAGKKKTVVVETARRAREGRKKANLKAEAAAKKDREDARIAKEVQKKKEEEER